VSLLHIYKINLNFLHPSTSSSSSAMHLQFEFGAFSLCLYVRDFVGIVYMKNHLRPCCLVVPLDEIYVLNLFSLLLLLLVYFKLDDPGRAKLILKLYIHFRIYKYECIIYNIKCINILFNIKCIFQNI